MCFCQLHLGFLNGLVVSHSGGQEVDECTQSSLVTGKANGYRIKDLENKSLCLSPLSSCDSNLIARPSKRGSKKGMPE